MDNKEGGQAPNSGISAQDEALGDAAYAELLPEFLALKPEELLVINVDVASVVTAVIGSLPEIRSLLPEIQKVSPQIDLAAINKLRTYALALSFAHARYLSTESPSSVLLEAVEAGTALRETLLRDAGPLAHRGLINQGRLNELQGVVGFKNVAIDLTILAGVLKEAWAQIENKCAIEPGQLDEALRLAGRIFTEVGLKEQGPPTVQSATDMRQRAFTALARPYDAVRQAVSFVRWKQDDVDKIAPSIYANRARAKRGPDNTSPAPVIPPAAPVPQTLPQGAPQAGSPPPSALNAPAPPADASTSGSHTDPFMR